MLKLQRISCLNKTGLLAGEILYGLEHVTNRWVSLEIVEGYLLEPSMYNHAQASEIAAVSKWASIRLETAHISHTYTARYTVKERVRYNSTTHSRTPGHLIMLISTVDAGCPS